MARARLPIDKRSEVIWHFSTAYGALVEAGAPDDLVRGVAYWLRRACREGLTDADLEHALESV